MSVTLEPMPLDVLDRLAVGDLAAAGRLIDGAVPPDFLDGQWIWQHFAALARAEPELAWWRTQYLVVDRERVVGHARLFAPSDREAQIGWHVDPIVRGRGLATAAAGHLVDLARSRAGVDRLVALIAPDNHASRRVAVKAGFRPDGEQRHRFGSLMRRFVLDLRA